MIFKTEQEALEWFEKDQRILTDQFIQTIPWHEVKNHPVAENLIPVLRYMRDIEACTEVYYQELCKSPTAKNKAIRRFMDRWSKEEPTHAELLHRFLSEAGIQEESWKQTVFGSISKQYRVKAFLQMCLAHVVGKRFGAVHMVWGAINEYCTLIGYKRLWEKAKHPVLEYILRAIVREEARHAFFYWSVARIYLDRHRLMRPVTRFIINHFWSPVGQGIKPKEAANYLVKQLFDGKDGLDFIHIHVNQRIAQLPGLDDLIRITERIAETTSAQHIALQKI